MKLPDRIKIGGFSWRIIHDGDVNYESNSFGSAHFRTQKIFIDLTAPLQKQVHTLIHEILHALWWEGGLRERYKEPMDEEIISVLSYGLLQVLRDNFCILNLFEQLDKGVDIEEEILKIAKGE